MIPTFEQIEKRIVLEGDLMPLDPSMPLDNGTPAIDFVGQYVDIEVSTLTGVQHISMPVTLYQQIQQMAEAGTITSTFYNAPPTAAPTGFFGFLVTTYEDWYTYFYGNPAIATDPVTDPSYFDMVIEEAINSKIPLIGVAP